MYAKWRIEDFNTNEWQWPRGWTLKAHTEKCLLAFEWLKEYKFIYNLYDTMNLSRKISYSSFESCCRYAVALHDIGKANSEFQDMIEAKEKIYLKYKDLLNNKELRDKLSENLTYQKIRHEMASFLFLNQNIEWFKETVGEFYYYVLAAIVGHHIKTDKLIKEDDAFKFRIFSKEIQDIINSVLNTNHIFKFNDDIEIKDPRSELSKIFNFKRTKSDPLSYAIKYILIICDILGSMTSINEQDRFEIDLKERICEILKPKSFNVVGEHRINPKAIDTPFPYQKECRTKQGSFLINIGCGGGKTATAFYACANEDLFCDKNIIFTTPLTSATSQLYLNVGNKEDGNRSSRSLVDKELYLADSGEDKENRFENDSVSSSFQNMLDDVTFATFDQVLGCLSYNRKSIFWLLHIINSKIVFDEFHAYDDNSMFWFKTFLDFFPKIDVVCMSATTTDEQEEIIKKSRPNVHIINNQNTEALNAPRYKFEIITHSQADNYFNSKMRTLWMVNVVGEAQDIAKRHKDALIFHARYKYIDKVKRQKEFVSAFDSKKPIRAVCTQIGEMSLDIYSDQMISEFCPVPDLIQRIGRASPRGRIPEKITTIYCYWPDRDRDCLPYSLDDLNKCKAFVQSLLGKEWSLNGIIEHFKLNYQSKIKNKIDLIDIFKTYKMSIREIQNQSTCLLESDVEAIKNSNKKYEIQKYEFSLYDNEIPKNDLTIFRHHVIVSKSYDSRLGILKYE